MRNIAIYISIPQLIEIRDLLSQITAGTTVVHQLTCAELYLYQKAYLRLLVKCQSKMHLKRNRYYKITFLPPEADIICKVLKTNPLPLTSYAAMTVNEFVSQTTNESENIKQTFLGQFY